MGEGIGIGAAARGLGQEAKDIGYANIEQQQANLTHLQAYQEYLKTVGIEHDDIQKLIKEHDAEVQAKVAAARKDVEAYKNDMANKAAPHRLTTDQFDRSSNVIYWPMVLRKAIFDDYRFQLDQLFHQRTAQNSGVSSDNDAAIQKACDEFLKAVGKDIKNLNIDQYITSRHFITSLQYEGRFAVK